MARIKNRTKNQSASDQRRVNAINEPLKEENAVWTQQFGSVELRNQGEVAELSIYEPIGLDGTDAKSFVEALQSIGNKPITVRVNSPGGSIFDALALYEALKRHERKVMVVIDGMALSAASVVAMAGDKITMAEGALLMMHDPLADVFGGTAREFEEARNLLDKVAENLAGIYSARSGQSREQVREWMLAETWFTAEEAVAAGLATDVSKNKALAASWDLSRFRNAPRTIQSQQITSLVTEEDSMKAELKTELVKRGLPENATDEEAHAWVLEFVSAAGQQPPTPPKPQVSDPIKVEELPVILNFEETVRKILKERDELHTKIRAACRQHKVEDKAEELCLESPNLETAYQKILEVVAQRQANLPAGVRLDSGPGQHEKHVAAIKTAMTIHCLKAGGLGEKLDQLYPESERDKNWNNFRYSSIFDLARSCVEADGYNTRALSRTQIAQIALGFAHRIGIRAEHGAGAYHTTGSFPELTKDAINKVLLSAFAEARTTYQKVFRQAASVRDFKPVHFIRLGEAPNLEVLPPNREPSLVSFADERESMTVEARSAEVSYDWRLLVNDDMDALSRTPVMLGNAARRTVNAVCWSIVTSNPTLVDSQKLYSAATGDRKKANLVSSGSGAPTIGRIGKLRELMRLQVGVNTPEKVASGAILNINPRFLVGPAALENAIIQVARSTADPSDNKSSAVVNPIFGLEPIIEPLLDANSATAYYLFADPAEADHVVYAFLQGQEEPQVTLWQDPRGLTINYTVLHSYQAAAVDHRGTARDDGVA